MSTEAPTLDKRKSMPPRGKSAAALASVAILALLVHGWIAAYDYYATTFTDSMDYLFMADFYRMHFYGGGSESVLAYYRGTRFPPLFPLILGALGAGSEQQHVASILSNAIAVAASLAVWRWTRVGTGSPWLAAGFAGALVLQPYFFVLNLSPVSEPLGVLLTASVFALVASTEVARSRILLAALLAGLAPLARAALLPLPIALLVWLACRRKSLPRPSGLAGIACVLSLFPYAGWYAYRRLLGAQQYEDFLPESSGDGSWHGVVGEIGIEVGTRVVRLVRAAHDLWCADPGTWTWVPVSLLIAAAATGCALRMRHGRADAWFLAGYVTLILLWPFPNEYRRFLILAYPAVLLCAWHAMDALFQRTDTAKAAQAAAALLATLVVTASLPSWQRFVHRAQMDVDDALLGEKREPGFFLQPTDGGAMAVTEAFGRARLLLMEADSVLPQGACIYSSPTQFARLYGKRASVEYPGDLGSDSERARSELTTCDWFFVSSWGASAYGLPAAYPSKALEGWTEPLLMSRFSPEHGGGLAAALVRRRDAEDGH